MMASQQRVNSRLVTECDVWTAMLVGRATVSAGAEAVSAGKVALSAGGIAAALSGMATTRTGEALSPASIRPFYRAESPVMKQRRRFCYLPRMCSSPPMRGGMLGSGYFGSGEDWAGSLSGL